MVEIEDTFAEAFPAYYSRILVTASIERWALIAAESTVGFGTSLIMCPSEAGIEGTVSPNETPDGRPGIIIQIWHPEKEKLEEQMLKRISQCAMTCPTTAVFNALESEIKTNTGYKIRFFGDGFEEKGQVKGRVVWKIPVMEGEFIIEESFGISEGIAGGNLVILGESQESALKAAEVAIERAHEVEGVIMSFPGGVCRCGSKVGAEKYTFLRASTNHLFCPTLREKVPNSAVPTDVKSVYEIVFNGMSLDVVKKAMKLGIDVASKVEGVKKITAVNFGGKLGPYKIFLREL